MAWSYKDFTYGAYKESDKVKKASADLANHNSAKPAEWTGGQYGGLLNDAMNKVLNREKFSYDLNGDALYQQYKNQYINQGRQAMMDTMGQAAALTGGYGNSYAQTVGQQTYQGYLQGLNDKVPELYKLALDKYNQDGADLMNQYGLLSDQYNNEYGRYRDSVGDWQNQRDYLANMYNNERNFDYGKYTDDRSFAYNKYSDNRSLSYQDYRNAIADAQWQKEFDESVRQYNENLAFQKAQAAKAERAAAAARSYDNSGVQNAADVESVLKLANGNPTYNAKAITDAYKSGIITQGEMEKLKNKYAQMRPLTDSQIKAAKSVKK